MFSKYIIIITDRSSEKPFCTILEFDDANEAVATYYDYVERELYDIVMYRRFKHDYVNI